MNPLPLYLHAREPLRVTLEPPALCIKSGDQSDRLYPLRRIERIQVSGPVQWHTDALLACADTGISVHFIDRRGETRGRLVGTGQARRSLEQNLRRLLNGRDWEVRYRQWCWAMGMQSQRYVASRLHYGYVDARELGGLPSWCEARLAGGTSKRNLGRILQWLHQDLYGMVTQRLHGLGLWNHSALFLEEPVDLARDITTILHPVLLILRERHLRGRRQETITHRRTAEWFAADFGFLDYQIARVINRLELWIMEDD